MLFTDRFLSTAFPGGDACGIPLLSAAHQVVVMVIARGKLQNLIFDNHALSSHRFMAAILRAIPEATAGKATHGQ
jgi:hypothetical protein